MSDPTVEGRLHLEQAYAHEENGDLDSALKECETAIHLSPDLAEAHNLEGIVLEQKGRRQQALDAYSEALRLSPDFQDARNNLNDLLGELRKSSLLQASRVAGWSALGFGVGFALVGWVSSIMPDLPPVVAALATILAYGLAGALGGLSLGHALKSTKLRDFVLVGFIGCGAGDFMIGEVYDRFLMSFPAIFVSQSFLELGRMVTWALLGGLLGAVLGMVQRDKVGVLLIAVAGAIGFGLELFLFDPVLLLLQPFLAVIPEANDAIRFSIVGLCYFCAIGIVGGYCIGFAMGSRWPNAAQDTRGLDIAAS